ncbi:unnamed protein product, partial [Brenthis ino]
MKYFVAILALVAVAAADVSHLRSPEADAVIVKQDADVFPDEYQYAYETSNGIIAQERGVLKNAGREDEGLEVQGSNAYTGPDGVRYETRYIANDGGYHAEGDHLPVPPAIPEYILRALEYIRTHPPKADN